MNERLKTLDDLGLNYKINAILRYEAIKWIKELNDSPNKVNVNSLNNRVKVEVDGKEMFDENEIENVMKIMMFNASYVMKWIKYFFGIKDEEIINEIEIS